MSGTKRARLLAAATTPALPAWLLATAAMPRTRADWAERVGWRVPPVSPGVLWLHAASVGEVGGAAALAHAANCRVLLTADTDTGVARARQVAEGSGGRIVAAARPIDHPWTLAPLWAEARPVAVAFVEGTWWPQLAALAVRDGVPLLRVSAKLGRSARLLRRFGLTRPLEDEATVMARSEAEQRVLGGVVTGDLKGDQPAPPALLRWSRPFVVGASTHAPEEEALLDARPRLPDAPALLLAPRRMQRVDGLVMLIEARGERWVRRSELSGVVPADTDVVLLDTLGELAAALVGARAAFVGGTFDANIGGHSGAEATAAGVPIAAGPQRGNNPESLMRAEIAARPSDIGDALERAMQGQGTPGPTGAAQRTWAHMRDRLHGWAPARTPRPWLRPAALGFSAGARVRNGLYDLGLRRVQSVDVPVVSIGSTNARGPGKTSTVRWWVGALQARGHTVGIALRGYRRTRPGRDVRLSMGSGRAEDLGDEGAWLQRVTGALVAAGPNRVEAARALVRAGATVVVLDDGLQHRRLHRDIDLAVVDGRDPNAGGVLPAGWARVPEAVPSRVHGVVLHHAWARRRSWTQDTVFADRRPGPWHCGDAPNELPGGPVVAFAGTARPGDFLASLADVEVTAFRSLSDHQPIDDALADELMRWADRRPLVCTGKDHVRLPRALQRHVWWRDVDLHIDDAPEGWLPGLA